MVRSLYWLMEFGGLIPGMWLVVGNDRAVVCVTHSTLSHIEPQQSSYAAITHGAALALIEVAISGM